MAIIPSSFLEGTVRAQWLGGRIVLKTGSADQKNVLIALIELPLESSTMVWSCPATLYRQETLFLCAGTVLLFPTECLPVRCRSTIAID